MSAPYEGDSTDPNTPGIKGTNTGLGGVGVFGESTQFEGVHGISHGLAAGVAGYNDNASNGPAVWGASTAGEGVHGETKAPNHAAVAGFNIATTAGAAWGVWGSSQVGEGVHGETNSTTFAAVAGIELNSSSNVAAVYGEQRGGGPGVFGIAKGAGAGVWGSSAAGEGIHGESSSPTFAAVAGITLNAAGTGVGIYGESRGQGPAGFFRGNVQVTGDVQLIGADCAEQFDIAHAESVEPGTVMTLANNGMLEPSQFAYDKRVAGIVSGAGSYRPGIVLDRQESQPNRRPIALVGKVYCKVDAQYGAVETGDLLTTSPTPGHAMKATDQFKAFGAVIGKALRPLRDGQGLIPILIALQ